jgi:hypothetical protein
MLRALFLLLLAVTVLCNPPTEAEVKAMKLKELREFLSDRGIPCEGCVEKSDFVRKVLTVKDTPILAEKQAKKDATAEPPKVQWKRVAQETCEAEKHKEETCKLFTKVVENSFDEWGRKYKRDLGVAPATLTLTSMSHPYKEVGVNIIKRTLAWVAKNPDQAKFTELKKKYETEFIPWLRDVGLDNPNPMYEELQAAKKGKGKGKKDEF